MSLEQGDPIRPGRRGCTSEARLPNCPICSEERACASESTAQRKSCRGTCTIQENTAKMYRPGDCTTPLLPHTEPTPEALSGAFLSVFLQYPISPIIITTPDSSHPHAPLMGVRLHPKTSSSTVKQCSTQAGGCLLCGGDPSYSHSTPTLPSQ